MEVKVGWRYSQLLYETRLHLSYFILSFKSYYSIEPTDQMTRVLKLFFSAAFCHLLINEMRGIKYLKRDFFNNSNYIWHCAMLDSGNFFKKDRKRNRMKVGDRNFHSLYEALYGQSYSFYTRCLWERRVTLVEPVQ